jgi:hypothetical protein
MTIFQKQEGVYTLTLHNDIKTLHIPHGQRIGTVALSREYANLSTSSPTEEYPLSPKKMYPYMNRQVPGEAVEFEPKAEPWTQYTLADGTEVKIKSVLLSAARLDEFTPSGEPAYQFQFQYIVSSVVPDALKRKPQ